jgi:hypothetical protein
MREEERIDTENYGQAITRVSQEQDGFQLVDRRALGDVSGRCEVMISGISEELVNNYQK